jgi:hypothetical protein
MRCGSSAVGRVSQPERHHLEHDVSGYKETESWFQQCNK